MRVVHVMNVLVVRRPHDDDAPTDAQHVHGRAVQVGQRLGGEHLVRLSDRPAPGGEIQHAVDHRVHGVDVVRDEDDGRPYAAPVRVEQARDDRLVGEVEREKRLVGEQEHGLRDERLRDAQPLLLAAGEPADRRVGIRRRSDLVERPVDARALVRRQPAGAPAVAVEPESDEISSAQREVTVEDALLRRGLDEWKPATMQDTDGDGLVGLSGRPIAYAIALPIVPQDKGAIMLYAENPPEWSRALGAEPSAGREGHGCRAWAEIVWRSRSRWQGVFRFPIADTNQGHGKSRT